MTIDLLLQGGTVVDGTGNERFVADVAVSGGIVTHVGEVDGRGGPQAHAAVDAAVPPLVLVLHVGGVRPAHDHRRERVALAGPDPSGEVELGGEARVLRGAERFAVEPEHEHALGPADLEHDPSPAPSPRHRELGAVQAGRVVVGDLGRLQVEGHRNVRVDRGREALHREAPRHRDLAPASVTERHTLPTPRGGLGPLDAEEPPVAVEAAHPRRVGQGRAGPRARRQRATWSTEATMLLLLLACSSPAPSCPADADVPAALSCAALMAAALTTRAQRS